MSIYKVPIGKLDLEAGIGHCLNDRAFKLNDIILLCQKNPSFLIADCLLVQKPFSTSVRIRTPCSVSATVFS